MMTYRPKRIRAPGPMLSPLTTIGNTRGQETVITTEDSKVAALLVPTNEELMIARDTMALVG